MLTIRPDQVELFEAQIMANFEEKLMAHSREFSPRFCHALGDDHLRCVVRNAIHRAGDFGFTCQGPLRLYLELTFLLGSGFSTDPQYSNFGAILLSHKSQMLHSLRLYEEACEYSRKVVGPGQAYMRQGITHFLDFLEGQGLASIQEHSAQEVIVAIYPQKTQYVGRKALRSLDATSRRIAREHNLEGAASSILLAFLMFAFGHSCVSDPLFPWISFTLRNPLHPDPTVRLLQLERKTKAWLRAMISAH